MKILSDIQHQDIISLEQKDKEYGGSWKKRGGAGAFMMLARKYNRIVVQVGEGGLFDAIKADTRPEGIMDDIRDLRRYVRLVVCHYLKKPLNSTLVVDDGFYYDQEYCWSELNRLWCAYEDEVKKRKWDTFLIWNCTGLTALYRLLIDIEGHAYGPDISV